MRVVQGFSCKDFGHVARDCPKKFCNYYKKQGHIISACPIRPKRKQGTAYHASTSASSSTALPAVSSVVPIPASTTLANPNTLTLEMVQQMIISAFSIFGLSGNHTISSKPWYFDSRASNHMTNTVLSLSNVRNYDGNMKINTTMCPEDDPEGPKVGRLFPLHVSPSTIIPSFPLLSFACNVVGSRHKMWHRRLGHPNSIDVWGIAPIVSHAHYKYFVTFIDDFSRSTWVYFLRAKAEVFSVFKCFLVLIDTQFSTSIKLFGHSPLYYDLRTFGCVCFVHLPTHERHKLTAQSVKCAFLGYAIPHKGYVCYDPHARRIRVSRNVIFFENQYFFPSHVELPFASVSLLPSFSESPTIVEGFKPGFGHERRSQHESNFTSSMPHSNLNLAPDLAPASTTLLKPIGSKWVFSVKLCSDGSLDRYKAYPVALGNKQEYGVDYEETFAPVAKMTTNAFLHGDLQEEIYMKLPSGMTNSSPHDVFLLLVYVDDIIIIGTDCSLITKLQQLLHTTFHMKDLRQLTYFLGLEVHHRASGIFVNQHKYIQDLITLAGLEDTSSVDTPMEFMTSPRHLHLAVVRRIISLSSRFTYSWYMFLGDSLISWRCKKQDRVSKSSTEVEYRAMSTACSKIIWLRGLLKELGFPRTTSTPLHADNTSAIQIATNHVFHERTKHIEVDYNKLIVVLSFVEFLSILTILTYCFNQKSKLKF
ncbi:hypothetical protein AAG906_035485 [Vitis piasezkii]